MLSWSRGSFPRQNAEQASFTLDVNTVHRPISGLRSLPRPGPRVRCILLRLTRRAACYEDEQAKLVGCGVDVSVVGHKHPVGTGCRRMEYVAGPAASRPCELRGFRRPRRKYLEFAGTGSSCVMRRAETRGARLWGCPGNKALWGARPWVASSLLSHSRKDYCSPSHSADGCASSWLASGSPISRM